MKTKIDKPIMGSKVTTSTTAAVFIFVGLAIAEACDHRIKRETTEMVASIEFKSFEGQHGTGSLTFIQFSSCENVLSHGSFENLDNGTYIGLIHQGQNIGVHCNKVGKAIALFSEREEQPQPLVAISEFPYYQEPGVSGFSEYASMERRNRNSIIDRILVIHRVPSNIQYFYNEALNNGHHASSIMCGLITSATERKKADLTYRIVRGIQHIIRWLWNNRLSVANKLAQFIVSLSSDSEKF
ncbi:uncharacterized protein [Venturia canescens]|uniref:uncharacterized protein n=1 Tax=Venturia canescens TaxID=32260 RepID=UPI001C9D3AFB|nr:uncharacterized protein LOC122409293 [Venturia canescens]